MEIERKFLIKRLPEDLEQYPCLLIEQAYLCTEPVVRIRKEDDQYWLTYKGKGLLAREEYNLPLTKEAYLHLLKKADGRILTKRRYKIPLPEAMKEEPSVLLSPLEQGLTVELDVFQGYYEGLILAEVEFPSLEEAQKFIPPAWFGRDVTLSGEYQNSRLSQN